MHELASAYRDRGQLLGILKTIQRMKDVELDFPGAQILPGFGPPGILDDHISFTNQFLK